MGARTSRPITLSYDEALKKLNNEEFERLQACFKRYHFQEYLPYHLFTKEILSDESPSEFSKLLFDAFGGTPKGITFRKLVCGLTTIAKGDLIERIKFLFSLFSTDGEYIYKEDLFQSIRALESHNMVQCIYPLFNENKVSSSRVNYDLFSKWILLNRKSLAVAEWLLDFPLRITAENVNCRTLYQTLSGVTHLDENDIVAIEKQYVRLVDNKIGKLTLEQFRRFVSPPILDCLVEGLFSAFDENGDGQIDFKEMVCGISACCRGPKAERHKFVFKIFDRKRTGVFNVEEVRTMVEQILLVKRNSADTKESNDVTGYDIFNIVESILETASLNGNNSLLTLDTFRLWCIRSNLLNEILSILYELCHVVFGLQPNSRRDESMILKNWKNRERKRGLKPGQVVYLVSTSWWKQWEAWLDSNEKPPPLSSRDSVSSKLTRASAYSGSVTSVSDITSPVELFNGPTSSNNCTNTGEDRTHLLYDCCQTPNSLSEKQVSPTNRSISCESGWESEPNLRIKETSNSIDKQSYSKQISVPSTTRSSIRSWSPCPRSPTPDDHVSELKLIHERPGPIENSDLVVSDRTICVRKLISLTSEGGVLRPDCSLDDGRDFVILPENLWFALTKWYRGGSPVLPRVVIISPFTGEPEIEFYPIVITLYRHQQQSALQRTRFGGQLPSFGTNLIFGTSTYSSESSLSSSPLNRTSFNQIYRIPMYTAAFSSMTLLGDVAKFLCRQLNLNAETVRLWILPETEDYADINSSSSFNNLTLLDDETMSLKELKIENGSGILIEIRNSDLTWPEEIISLIKSGQNRLTRDHQTCERGLTGLTNLGNTCFMNSALQCISNTQPLTQYFTRNVHLYELNKDNDLGMKGQIALQYANLIRDLWSGNTRVTAPLKLRWTVCKYAPTFNDFNQHDCQELLSFLLDGLHEDLNRVKQKTYLPLNDSAGRKDEIVAAEAWKNHTKRNQSIIVDLFHGLLKSTVVCRTCNTTSVTFDPFTFLSLPLPLDNFVFIQIVVVPLDGRVPTKYGLRLKDDLHISDTKKQLSELCNVHFSQMLVLRLSANSLIQEILQNEYRVKNYGTCLLYAFELPKRENNDVKFNCNSHTSTENQPEKGTTTNCAPTYINASPVLLHRSFSSAQNSSQEFNNEFIGHRRSNSLIDGGGSPIFISSKYNNQSEPFYCCRFNGFTIGVQRRMEPNDFYFVSHNRYKPTVFGLPMILPADVDERTWSGRGLYDSVLRHVQRLIVAAPNQMSQINHAFDGDENLYSEYPFELKLIAQNGYCMTRCLRCPWFRFCTGCKIEPRDDLLLNGLSECFIAVDWDITALHLRYRAALEMQFEEHQSVEEAYRLHTEPITLDSCLKAFTQPEELKDRDNYYCSKCKTHCPAYKKLDIWKLPPILIFHFKRFHCVNDKWVKSCKSVKFPRNVFDPSQYLATTKDIVNTTKDATDQRNFPQDVVYSAVSLRAIDCCFTCEEFKSAMTKNENCEMLYQNGSCKPFTSSENKILAVKDKLTGNENETLHSNLRTKLPNGNTSETAVCTNGNANTTPSENHSESIPVLKCGEHDHRLKATNDKDENSELQYDLYAISCHAGLLGAGHYVAYARNMNGKWYLYNDSRCKEINPDDIDTSLAYILFYERRGLDYGKYIPNLADRSPYSNDDAADREVESEVRKTCCLQ